MDPRVDVDGACRSCSSSLELEPAGTPLNINSDRHWIFPSNAVQGFDNADTQKPPALFDADDSLSYGQLSQVSLADNDNALQQAIRAFNINGNTFLENTWPPESTSYSNTYSSQEPTFQDLWLDPAPAHPSTTSVLPPPPDHLRGVLERIEALEAVATIPLREASGCTRHRAISRNPNPPLRRQSRAGSKAHHKCKYANCNTVSTSSKDRKRHELQVHNKPEPGELRLGWYVCSCSQRTSRKDTLKRHMTTCKNEPLSGYYFCRCLEKFIERNAFDAHISDCGAKSKGRPALPR